MRPNLAQDAPPTSITIGGRDYDCNVDFLVWIDVLRLLRGIETPLETPQQLGAALGTLLAAEQLVFNRPLCGEDPAEVLEAMAEFARGYPCAPVQSDGYAAAFSFDCDLNEILIAIRNQSGIDLSYRRRTPFHWWEFLLEFRTLSGDHYILNLMQARSYRGSDRDLMRRRRMCALPPEYSAAERAEMDAFEALFTGGSDENQD